MRIGREFLGAVPIPPTDLGAGRKLSTASVYLSVPHRCGMRAQTLLESCSPLRLGLPRKEVIQPQLPLRLPCYDFVPITRPTLGACLLLRG